VVTIATIVALTDLVNMAFVGDECVNPCKLPLPTTNMALDRRLCLSKEGERIGEVDSYTKKRRKRSTKPPLRFISPSFIRKAETQESAYPNLGSLRELY
jgi:hypothetical protein